MRKSVFVFLVLALLLAACGGGGSEKEEKKEPVPAGAGDPSKGEKLFKETLIGSQPGCITCHSLESGVTLVGPSQSDIGARAGTRVSGLSAEEYLRQSILEPDAHVVEDFAAGTMPVALADELSEQQVKDLIAYMLTLK